MKQNQLIEIFKNCDKIFWGLLLLGFFLIFTNLGFVYLWEDEAETALVAKTVLSNGIPKITDGVNFFYQEQGKRVGHGDIWAWTPWLQFYIVAPFLKFFGSNAWAARLPFAVIGFLSIPLFFRFTRKLFDVPVARLATLVFVCSVPFLLHVRQCRYYSVVLFCIVWALNALAAIEDKKTKSAISLFFALFFLFHASYLAWFGVVVPVFIFVFSHGLKTEARQKIFGSAFFSVLINAPWFFLFKPLHDKIQLSGGASLLEHKIRMIDWSIYQRAFIFYLTAINDFIFPLLVLLFIPVIFKQGSKCLVFNERQKRWIVFLLSLVLFTVAFSLLGPAHVFRYISGIIPIVILLLSLILAALWMRSKAVCMVVVCFLIFTNSFQLVSHHMLSLLFPSIARTYKVRFESAFLLYLHELFLPPRGSNEAIIRYLKENGKPNDLVVATYGNLPIMFYTGYRVIGGMALEGLKDAQKADWIVPRKALISDEDARVMVYLIDNLDWKRYEKINLPETDFPWENIPEPGTHQFKNPVYDPKWAVQIYRKLKSNEAPRRADPPSLFYFNATKNVIEGTQVFRDEVIRYLLWLAERKENKK